MICGDIASLVAASTLVNLIKGAIQGKGRSGICNALASLAVGVEEGHFPGVAGNGGRRHQP